MVIDDEMPDNCVLRPMGSYVVPLDDAISAYYLNLA